MEYSFQVLFAEDGFAIEHRHDILHPWYGEMRIKEGSV